MNTKIPGKEGEDLACMYIKDIGGKILSRNYSIRDAEIDIIFEEPVKDNPFDIRSYIVFAEVKLRNSGLSGSPYESVTKAKMKKIAKAAKQYLYVNHFPESTAIRFDVISIENGAISHYRDAFEP